jgi:hypothetical protein
MVQSRSMPRRTPGRDSNGDGREERVPFRDRLACSVSDAEAASGISRSGLYLEMKAGRLDYFRRGSRRLIRVPSLLNLIDSS